MGKQTTVGEHLARRLKREGLKHIFGVPGDYVLGLYDTLLENKLDMVGACTEAGAAFAADAYGRISGLSCVCVTYAVGGLNTVNAVAGAYAEKSPMIVISGAPGLGERASMPMLHHRVKDFQTQRLIFERVTVKAVVLDDAALAPGLIDEAIEACKTHKRPVYIEVPRDMVDARCEEPRRVKRPPRVSDRAALDEAIGEAVTLLRAAKRPAILGGVEIHRFGLQDKFLRLVKRTGFPVAATLLGKSVISELHEQYLGVYEGAMGREDVRKRVEGADCVLILGAFMTDINLGIYTAKLDVARTINATSESIQIKNHRFDDIVLADFIDGLARKLGGAGRTPKLAPPKQRKPTPFRVKPKQPVTIRRFFARMNDFLREENVVIADIGDCLFGAADLTIHRRTEFLSPAYYTSMGFAIPATLGAHCALPDSRAIVFVGDGAFQMTGLEMSTIARLGFNPIVFVLNNKGYTTERFIHEGPYNDIHEWSYHRLPDLLGVGRGFEARTEGELEDVLAQALANRESYSIVNLHLDPLDHSTALERLGRRLAKQSGLADR